MKQKQHQSGQCDQQVCQDLWLPLLCGMILTLLFLELWQQGLAWENLHTQQLAEGRSLILPIVVWSSLAGAWGLALMVYLIQRTQNFAQRTRKVNQQLQDEIIYRQQVEANLRQSEERWQLALRGNHDGIWDWNVQTNEITYSSRCKEILGYADHEHGNQPHDRFQLLHPQDRNWVIQALKNHLAQKTEFYVTEHRVRCKDGSYKWILDRGQAIWDEAGQSVRMVGSHSDITERKQAEIASQESERKYRQLIDHTDAGFVVHAADTRILQCNAIACNLLGLTIDQMLGKTAIDPAWHFVREDGTVMPLAEYPVNRVLSTQAPLKNFVAGVVRETEPQTWLLVSAFPEFDEYEQIKRIIVTFIDISDRKRSENALYHLAAIIESSEDAIISKSLEGIITSWNSSAEKLFGYTAMEMIGQSVRTLIPTDRLHEANYILEKIQRGEQIANYDTQRRRKDGTLIEVSVSVSPIKDLNGRIIGASKIVRDVRNRKQQEQILRQAIEAAESANFAKSMFLANMSHELRTPLSVILGFAQVMSHDPALTPRQQEDLNTIRRSGDHLLNLINDVLDLSKIEVDHLALRETGFDLMALLKTLRIMMIERANAKQLQLEFDIAPEISQFIITDEQKLRQILLNLLSNAIKFTDQGGVTLRVSRQESCEKTCPIFNATPPENRSHCTPTASYRLQFEVIDTGVGIAPEEQSTIFDAFTQAESGRKSMSGTGLGLTISRKLIELMHGSISVSSIPNQGSTFTFTIPVCPISSVYLHVDLHRPITGLVPGQPRYRILIVDDQSENRQVLVRLLDRLDLDIREAINGQEAIQIWQEWHPDLIWMDIRMPGMDGYEATQQIRSMEQTSTCVIIALTAQAVRSDRVLALAAGCNDYITKPFQEETLFLKLQEHLGLKYRYAEPDDPEPPPVISANPDQNEDQSITNALTPDRLNHLPQDWLNRLEDAAMKGDDRMILELATLLSPEMASLGTQLQALANRFQFEKIVDWIRCGAPF